MDDLIGKLAYKKYGFFSHIVGKIEKSDSGFTPYKLVDPKGETIIGFRKKEEIVLVENQEK